MMPLHDAWSPDILLLEIAPQSPLRGGLQRTVTLTTTMHAASEPFDTAGSIAPIPQARV